jgi:YHS domain-containing protein
MRLLIYILIAYAVYQMFRNRTRREVADDRPAAEETHRDPVCGVYVTHEAAVVGNLDGEKIYFCSLDCLEKFRDQLEKKPAS